MLSLFTKAFRGEHVSITFQSIRTASVKVQPQDDGTYKGEKLKRFGYEPHFHQKGLLPRLKRRESRLRTMPISAFEDDWSKRKSRAGENDFVTVFGDDELIKNEDLMTHIPDYLKGIRADHEYSVLMRKRREFEYWKETKPLRHLHMEQRIKFLYRRFNNKYKPPGVELVRPDRY